MSIPKVLVTCYARNQSGLPIVNAKYVATLDRQEIFNGFIVPTSVMARSDGDGMAILELWPNSLGSTGSSYTITGTDPVSGRTFVSEVVTVPNSNCFLHEILNLKPLPPIDAVTRALTSVQASLSAVSESASIVTNAAASMSVATALVNSMYEKIITISETYDNRFVSTATLLLSMQATDVIRKLPH